MSEYINISGIKKRYKKKEVLKGIDLKAGKGEIIGIIGNNGSGKSTLLSILAGALAADSGVFECGGSNLLTDPKTRRKTVGYVPQGNALMEELSAMDNLLLWAEKKDIERELENGVLAMLGIDSFIKTTVSKMSGGMKKRLSIGCTVVGHPDVLLLDEPCAALDIVCKDSIYDYFRQYVGDGGTILMATHELYEIGLCNRCVLLKDGVFTDYVYDGDAHRLAALM